MIWTGIGHPFDEVGDPANGKCRYPGRIVRLQTITIYRGGDLRQHGLRSWVWSSFRERGFPGTGHRGHVRIHRNEARAYTISAPAPSSLGGGEQELQEPLATDTRPGSISCRSASRWRSLVAGPGTGSSLWPPRDRLHHFGQQGER